MLTRYYHQQPEQRTPLDEHKMTVSSLATSNSWEQIPIEKHIERLTDRAQEPAGPEETSQRPWAPLHPESHKRASAADLRLPPGPEPRGSHSVSPHARYSEPSCQSQVLTGHKQSNKQSGTGSSATRGASYIWTVAVMT